MEALFDAPQKEPIRATNNVPGFCKNGKSIDDIEFKSSASRLFSVAGVTDSAAGWLKSSSPIVAPRPNERESIKCGER